MRFIFNLCDRVAVLVQGEKLVEGTADVVQADERVIAAYLGTPFEGDPGEAEAAEVREAGDTEADDGAGAAAAAPHRERRAPEGRRPMTALLEVEDLRVAYGKIEAVKGISFTVEAGEVVTLIGTNGAGKTTTLRTLSGLLKPLAGKITFDGEPTQRRPRPQDRRHAASPTPPKAAASSPA